MGVMGVAGEESLLRTRKLRSMVEKSESFPECSDEELDDADENFPISGAVKACTLVVEMSSVGREIILRLMVPGAYLTVFPLASGEEVAASSSLRRTRLVKARARDMI